MHCIRLSNKIDPYAPPQRKRKLGLIRPRSENDQITTLPCVGVKNYYDGSVAFYISFLSMIKQSQSCFLFD